MRIGFFTDTYYPDLNGVSVSVSNFTKELRSKGHTVYIFVPKIEGKYKQSDKDLIRLPSFKIISSAEPQVYSPTIWPNESFRKMFTTKFDIIHAHGNGPYSFLGYSIARVRRIPFTMTFHTIHTLYTHYIFKGKIITPKIVSVGLKTFAQRCNAIIVPSEKMKKELIKYGVKKKIHIVPNFLQAERFKNNKKGYLHDLLSLPRDIPLILTVGRIGKEKNIDFILQVFKRLLRKDNGSHLVVVGKGPEKDNLMALAKSLGIAERTHFTGVIDQRFMPLVYKDSSIFVFASFTETQGICVLEAAAAGIPCVVNNDEVFKDIVKNGKNGYRLPLDEEKFADKINYLLKNEDVNKKMSSYGTKIASANFNAAAIVDNLINIYSHTIDSGI